MSRSACQAVCQEFRLCQGHAENRTPEGLAAADSHSETLKHISTMQQNRQDDLHCLCRASQLGDDLGLRFDRDVT